jgi:hypothetical protein
MADPAQAIKVIVESSQWNKYGDDEKLWSMKFHFTGVTEASDSEISALFSAFLPGVATFLNGSAYIKQALYYPQDSDINSYQESYTAATHPGTATGYAGFVANQVASQLEVCHLFSCPEKISSKGKQVYLRKFFHVGAINPTGGAGSTAVPFQPSSAGAATLETWTTGIGTNELVVTGPSGVAPSGTWSIRPYLVTRQLRKTPKGQ